MKSALIALLAFCLCWGVGCSKNISEFESFEETKTRAEKGDDIAQVNLGYMYANGEGVIQDIVYAHMWLNIAASEGNETAKVYRDDVIAIGMTPSQIEEAQRLARECVKKNYKGC